MNKTEFKNSQFIEQSGFITKIYILNYKSPILSKLIHTGQMVYLRYIVNLAGPTFVKDEKPSHCQAHTPPEVL